MAEYIEREAAMSAFEHECNQFVPMYDNYANGYRRAVKTFNSLPAANVRENVIRTQADRIRATSDEELEKAITDRSSVCPRGRYEGDYDCESFEDCHACWLDWLKSPVEVEE